MLKRILACTWLLLATSYTFGQASTQQSEFDALLNSCIEKQFDEQSSPVLNEKLDLLESCPDLAILLATREDQDFIQPRLSSDTTLNRLIDERTLRQHPYSAVQSTNTDLNLLAELAKKYQLNDTLADEPSWWARFTQWLKDNYGSDNEDTDIDWLIKLLDEFSLPEWLFKTIFYGSIGLVILLAIIIIVNEFRHYKRYQNRDKHSANTDSLAHLHALRKLSWDEVLALPVHQKAAALLQYLIQQCITRDWLPDNNSFTNREFYQRLKKIDVTKAMQFNQVVNAAEQTVYGKHPLSAEEVSTLISLTEAILNDEQATPA